jgi:hypothetical protein
MALISRGQVTKVRHALHAWVHIPASLTIARTGVWCKRGAHHAYGGLVSDQDGRIVSRRSLFFSGIPDLVPTGWPDQTCCRGNDHGGRRDGGKQEHITVFFANSHAEETWRRKLDSGHGADARPQPKVKNDGSGLGLDKREPSKSREERAFGPRLLKRPAFNRPLPDASMFWMAQGECWSLQPCARWCRLRGLNSRPSVYKTAALPLS